MTLNQLINELHDCEEYGDVDVQFALPDGKDLTHVESLPVGGVWAGDGTVTLVTY